MKPKNFKEAVGQAIGEASMCWSETPKGVFDSTRASNIVDEILNYLDELSIESLMDKVYQESDKSRPINFADYESAIRKMLKGE